MTSTDTASVVVVEVDVETMLLASNGANACGVITTVVGAAVTFVGDAVVVGGVVDVVVEEEEEEDGGGVVVVVEVEVDVVVVAATEMENCTIADAVAAPTVAVMVTLADPLAMGVPVMTPVAEFSVRPAGRTPLVTTYEMPAPTVDPLNNGDMVNAVSATMSTLIARGTNTEVEAATPAPPLLTARSSNT